MDKITCDTQRQIRDNIVEYLLKARTMNPTKDAVARERFYKHTRC
jgi:hypothetical protein